MRGVSLAIAATCVAVVGTACGEGKRVETATPDAGPAPAARLRARIRRLSNAELAASLAALFPQMPPPV